MNNSKQFIFAQQLTQLLVIDQLIVEVTTKIKTALQPKQSIKAEVSNNPALFGDLDSDENANLQSFVVENINCSICQQKMSGLIMICIMCLHGGHMAELKSWF